MEAIAINKKKQGKLNKHVKKVKGQLNKGIQLKKEVKSVKVKGKLTDSRGVVYLGHIPHGFFEDEIRAYCSQFGNVTRVRVARSKKTGKSKGYAFVEFQHPEVAQIVADTINNYLMFNRLISCQYIPPEKRHQKMFLNSVTATKFPAQKSREKDTKRKNSTLDASKEDERKLKNRRKIEDFKKFFEERGIEFNFKINDPNGDLNVIQTHPPAVLEIDESDDEVEFNTPPHVTKVFKKANKSSKLKLKTPCQQLKTSTVKKVLLNKDLNSEKMKNGAKVKGSNAKKPKLFLSKTGKNIKKKS